ncbi:hypothetical protein GCM10009753_70910 [Streptantibioticus ferralitis]
MKPPAATGVLGATEGLQKVAELVGEDSRRELGEPPPVRRRSVSGVRFPSTTGLNSPRSERLTGETPGALAGTVSAIRTAEGPNATRKSANHLVVSFLHDSAHQPEEISFERIGASSHRMYIRIGRALLAIMILASDGERATQIAYSP